jgi:hypothetical protein
MTRWVGVHEQVIDELFLVTVWFAISLSSFSGNRSATRTLIGVRGDLMESLRERI